MYYFNTMTKESRWDRPGDFVAVAAERQPPEVCVRRSEKMGLLNSGICDIFQHAFCFVRFAFCGLGIPTVCRKAVVVEHRKLQSD